MIGNYFCKPHLENLPFSCKISLSESEPIVEIILFLMILILPLLWAAGPFPPAALPAVAQFKCKVLKAMGRLFN